VREERVARERAAKEEERIARARALAERRRRRREAQFQRTVDATF